MSWFAQPWPKWQIKLAHFISRPTILLRKTVRIFSIMTMTFFNKSSSKVNVGKMREEDVFSFFSYQNSQLVHILKKKKKKHYKFPRSEITNICISHQQYSEKCQTESSRFFDLFFILRIHIRKLSKRILKI